MGFLYGRCGGLFGVELNNKYVTRQPNILKEFFEWLSLRW